LAFFATWYSPQAQVAKTIMQINARASSCFNRSPPSVWIL